MKGTLMLLMFFVALFSACAPGVPSPEPAVQPAPSLTPVSPGGYPPAVFAATRALSERLAVPVERIQVAGVEALDWPDSCLGLAHTDEMCAEVITPGYRILLQVDLARYEFHSDADGANLRQALGVTPGTSGEEARPALSWENADCDQLSVTLETVFYGRCAGPLVAAPEAAPAAVETITRWLETYAAFDEGTPAGKVSFHGFGSNVATPADQRMMAEWAQLTFTIVQSGQMDPSRGLALAYQREGGIAGFCDDVTVYLAGYAHAGPCGGTNWRIPLNASQLQRVYEWYDNYRQVDYAYTDPAVADAITVRLSMPGRGSKPASQGTVRAMAGFASDLLAQESARQQADPSTLEAAEGAIVHFLTALNAGDYILAARLYGGDTALLASWNPDIEDDLPAWLERGCIQNGLQCMLPRSLLYRGQDADGAHQFLIEYNKPDGGLFLQGPCYGDENGLVNPTCLIRARQRDGLWQVLDLPPYVP